MIDVQKLAREAGFEVHERKKEFRVGIDALIGIDSTAKLERFAALVLEEAAKACDDIWQEDGTAMQCRAAIPLPPERGSFLAGFL